AGLVGVIGRAETDAQLRQAGVDAAQRVVLAAADLELGGQVVGPVAEQLRDRGVHGLGDGEPARIQAQRGVARAGQGRVHLLQLGEAGRQAVVVVDVPVDLGGVL